MKIVIFITDHQAVDRIIDHPKLVFVADKLPPSRIALQELLVAVEALPEYFS